MTTPVGGDAQPVTVSTSPPKGLIAVPAYGYTPDTLPADIDVEGGDCLPVYVVSDAELAAGTFILRGDLAPVRLIGGTGRPTIGDVAPMPVYLVGGGFDPAPSGPPLSDTLVVHYDAQSITGLANGDAVATVTDVTGGGRDLPTANSPTYQAAAINGYPAIRFNGTNQSARATFADTIAQPFTIYAVARPLALDADRRIFDSSTVNEAALITIPSGTSFGSLARYSAYAGADLPAATGPQAGQAGVFSLVFTGGANQLFNPNRSGAVTRFQVNASALAGFTLGAAGNLVLPANVDIGEILIYSGAHSATERRQVEIYLADRWGITWPRELLALGDSLTVGQGSDGSTAGGTTGPYTYQLRGLLGNVNPISIDAAGGRTAAQVAAGAAAPLATRDTSFTRGVCLVWAGTNALYGGGTAAAAHTSLRSVWAAARAAGWAVVAFTVLPRSDVGTPVGFEVARQSLNTLIRADTTLYDALADVAANTTIGDAGDETNATYYADLVHLTDAGYAIVADIARDAMVAAGL